MPFYRTKYDPDDTIVGCTCWCEGLKVCYDPECNELYLSLCFAQELPWRERLRVAWRIITHGNYWPDHIALEGKYIPELAEWLMSKTTGGDT